MYCDRHVARRIALAEDLQRDSGQPITLVHHEVWEVDEFEEELRRRGHYVYGPTGLPIATRNLTPRQSQWMLNEQLLVMCDAAYACNPPEAPIWMADLTFKSLGDVKVGDSVVGWVKAPNAKANHTEMWASSKVVAVMRRISPIIKVTLSNGNIIRCTPDHLWSSGNHDKGRYPWRPARVGWFLRRVVDVYPNEPSDARKATWLGGLYDGEGSKTKISQYQEHNPEVYARMTQWMTDLGFKFSSCPEHIQFSGGRSEYARFLAWCQPVRRKSIEAMIFGKRVDCGRDQIISVEPDGEGEVVSLQTETGNYVAWGYASKNCTRYGWVTDEEGVIRRFQVRMAQKILFDVISDLEDQDAAIEIQILKARQLGMTTLVELLIMFRIIFSNGVNAIIASADRQKSKMMGKKLLMGYDMLPIWLRPQFTSRVETEQGELTFGQLNSGVYVQHGNQMSGIARGSTPTLYHLSECASFTNAKEQIEASLFKAVHASPSIFGILESTGEGDEGWWAETWHYSKENWPTRTCRLCPIFFPWVIGRDLYPKPAWLRMRPVPEAFYEHRLPDTREHVARVEAYIANTPLLRKQLGGGWRMPIEQQWFWEVGHEEHKAKGMEFIWYQEMAGDDIEALQRSSESVFGHDTMIEVRESAVPDFQVYGLSGQSIEDDHEPPVEDIDYGTHDNPRARIPVSFRSPRDDSYRWELIPLKHSIDYVNSLKTKPDAFRDYANGKLMVFHPPQPGIDYSIGVDTSNGMGQDSTVICVTAPAQRPGQPDVQVAEFRSAYVSHVEAYAFIMCIGAFYAQLMESSTPHRQPICGIEQIQSVGDVAQVQMRKMGWTRFHQFIRYDGKDLKKSKSRKMGWYTNSWSRPILIDSFVHSVQNGWYIVNSPWLMQEMDHFEVHYTASGKEKKEHEDGEHDDGMFAAAISEIIVNDIKTMTERSKKRFSALGQSALPPLDIERFAGHKFPSKPGANRVITTEDIIYSSSAEMERWG